MSAPGNRILLLSAILAVGLSASAQQGGPFGPVPPDVTLFYAAADVPALRKEIPGLIGQLGDASWAKREAAQRRLIEIGPLAVPAVAKALGHSDAEVRERAERIHRQLTSEDASFLQRVREEGTRHFYKGDYEAMVRSYARVGLQRTATFEDRLHLGHALQLAGRWEQAVKAYEWTLRTIDFLLAMKAPATRPATYPAAGVAGVHPPDAASREKMRRARGGLIFLVGRIQREQLADNAAAAATFTRALPKEGWLTAPIERMAAEFERRGAAELGTGKRHPAKNLSLPHMYIAACMKALAETLERQGRHREALTAWLRLRLADALGEVHLVEPEMRSVARLLRKLPVGELPAATPGVIVLTPERPTVDCSLTTAAGVSMAFRHEGFSAPGWCEYLLVPPAGSQFEAITFTCVTNRPWRVEGNCVHCWTFAGSREDERLPLGDVPGPTKESGRTAASARIAIPAGIGPVIVGVSGSGGSVFTRSWRAEATFRKAQETQRAAAPPSPFRFDALPRRGTLTVDGDAQTPRALAPGRHEFTYSHPKRKNTFRAVATVPGGETFGLFVNLDSPFRWRFTNLRRMGFFPPARAGMVRLADGRWLLAYRGAEGRIMLATSRDVLRWDTPRALGHCRFANHVAPAVTRDRNGTIWLAYFSNRLDPHPLDRGPHRMFLTHSRDGRTWSRPRPIPIAGDNPSSPTRGIHLMQDAAGRCWIFWSRYAGSAETFEDIQRLDYLRIDLDVGGPMKLDMYSPHVVVDGGGKMHMVFHSTVRGVHWTTSAEGKEWSKPVLLARGEDEARLLLDGGRVVLVTEYSARGGELSSLPKLGPPVRYCSKSARCLGCGPVVTPEGKVRLLAGSESVWLLEADLSELTGAAPKP